MHLAYEVSGLKGLYGDLDVADEVGGHQYERFQAVRPGEAGTSGAMHAVELDEEEGVALVADRK
jgi:hypothetical protein